MFFVRQGATHKVVIGPAVAVGDGFTPVTTLVITGGGAADEAEAILHDNGTVVDISAYTFAAIAVADGYYHLTLQSGISNTVGQMTIVINDDSLILPLRADFTILDTLAYDAMYKDAAVGPLLSDDNGANLVEAGGTGDQLTAIPIQTQVNDALVALGLDHLISAAVTGADVADDSIIAFMVSKEATADWDDFVNTTESLQALRDNELTDIKTVTDQLVAAQAEPTGVPAANETPLDKIAYSFMMSRNKLTVTATKKTYFDDGGAAEFEKDVSSDGTTYTETEANAI